MEEFSRAYVLAVAAAAGFAFQLRSQDQDSIDLTLLADSGRRPSLDIQLKSTGTKLPAGATFPFELSRKNYDDLRAVTITPRILVVVALPRAVSG